MGATRITGMGPSWTPVSAAAASPQPEHRRISAACGRASSHAPFHLINVSKPPHNLRNLPGRGGPAGLGGQTGQCIQQKGKPNSSSPVRVASKFLMCVGNRPAFLLSSPVHPRSHVAARFGTCP